MRFFVGVMLMLLNLVALAQDRDHVEGEVRDIRGVPMQNTEIEVCCFAQLPGLAQSVFTGADGRFSIYNLRPGQIYTIRARHPEKLFTPEQHRITPDTVGVQVFRETLPSGIAGWVADPRGERISSIQLRVLGEHPLRWDATTDHRGNYRIPGLLPGVYQVEPVTPGYEYQPARMTVRVEGNRLASGKAFTARRLEAPAGGFTLAGRIIAGDETELLGLMVGVQRCRPARYDAAQPDPARRCSGFEDAEYTRSLGDGSWSMARRAGGFYRVFVDQLREGQSAAPANFFVTVDGRHPRVDFRITTREVARYQMRGRVLGDCPPFKEHTAIDLTIFRPARADCSPGTQRQWGTPGARIIVKPCNGRSTRLDTNMDACTGAGNQHRASWNVTADSKGRFTIDSLHPGYYEVRADKRLPWPSKIERDGRLAGYHQEWQPEVMYLYIADRNLEGVDFSWRLVPDAGEQRQGLAAAEGVDNQVFGGKLRSLGIDGAALERRENLILPESDSGGGGAAIKVKPDAFPDSLKPSAKPGTKPTLATTAPALVGIDRLQAGKSKAGGASEPPKVALGLKRPVMKSVTSTREVNKARLPVLFGAEKAGTLKLELDLGANPGTRPGQPIKAQVVIAHHGSGAAASGDWSIQRTRDRQGKSLAQRVQQARYQKLQAGRSYRRTVTFDGPDQPGEWFYRLCVRSTGGSGVSGLREQCSKPQSVRVERLVSIPKADAPVRKILVPSKPIDPAGSSSQPAKLPAARIPPPKTPSSGAQPPAAPKQILPVLPVLKTTTGQKPKAPAKP